MTPKSYETANILVVIPVRNEARSITAVVKQLRALGFSLIRVVDNGSTDDSATYAAAAGAEVLYEPRPGYGQACWRGLQQLPPDVEWILFCDGDGSDDLSSLPQWGQQRQAYDLMLSDRTATEAGRRVLTPAQRWGNALATSLIWLGWGHRYRDLGPLRLIRRQALEAIAMQDRGFGWTVEMQVRALELGLRVAEFPARYYPRRSGKSKISGTLWGSLQAGWIILTTLGKLYVWKRAARGEGFIRGEDPKSLYPSSNHSSGARESPGNPK
ncbi:MAG: glycosyltransferase family 2 protein [Elainellaceae cyanobacterium]